MFEHGCSSRQDFTVPEAQHPESFAVQKSGAEFILPPIDMLATVELDDQAAFQADEIGDVFADRLLAAKLAAAELPAPRITPQVQPGIGLRTAQISRQIVA
ncbi:MAG TPA: hypothetical protein VHE37_05700 [Nevskiaceae bacterium]|nr:hypothetical protein [Nevskiaceae bacterium]